MIKWTGKNLKEVIEFTGKSERFYEWFPTWEDFETHVKNDGNTIKIIKSERNEIASIGDWIYKDANGENHVMPSDRKDN